MSELHLSYPASVIAGKMRLTSEDIGILRDHVFAGGITSSQDAVILLAINSSCSEKCREWPRYFIDTMTRFIVRFCYPQGSMDELNTEWLIPMISRQGIVASRPELELLFHIVDVSAVVPDTLSHFALEQVRLGLMDRQGVLGRDRGPNRGLQKTDVQRVTRVMTAIARSRGSALTPREQRVLSRLGVFSQATIDNTSVAA